MRNKNLHTLVYFFIYICKMERKINKSKLFSFKASEQFLEIMRDLADKKGMSQASLIEYLVRREDDFNKTIEKPKE